MCRVTSQRRRDGIVAGMEVRTEETSSKDILQRLVRRYLFKLERQKDEGKEAVGLGLEVGCGPTIDNSQGTVFWL